MQKITTSLWFNGNAKEAVKFYISIFKGKIKKTSYYTRSGMGRKEGDVLSIVFEIIGQEFMAINAGPEFSFTPAISLMVNCKNQKEVDKYWKALTKGGKGVQCGWLEDKYGLSWQVTPTILPEMLHDKNRKRADRVMQAMMGMVKIDIKKLEAAYKEK